MLIFDWANRLAVGPMFANLSTSSLKDFSTVPKGTE